MTLSVIIISCSIVVILSAIAGFFIKGKTNIKAKWESFSNFMQWVTYLLIFASIIILIFFKDAFLSAILSSEFFVGLTVLTILIIGFPLLTLITIGFWIGDFFEWIYRMLSK